VSGADGSIRCVRMGTGLLNILNKALPYLKPSDFSPGRFCYDIGRRGTSPTSTKVNERVKCTSDP
jgi:hypothetical protein